MKRAEKLTKKQKKYLQNIIIHKESSAKEIKRAQAVLMINDEIKGEMIKTLTGLNEKHAYRLRRNYLSFGKKAITDKRKPKQKEILTKTQLKEIIETVKNKTPNEIDAYYNNDYWTTGILGEYIKRVFKTNYKSKTSLYLIFKKSKFSYHKPGRVYEKQDEKEVAEWRITAKEKIKSVWADKNTVILCEDEMVLSTQTTFQKIWLKKNEYPKIKISNTKKNRSIYGFLNIRTGKEHTFKTEWQNMHITVDVLKGLREIYPIQKLLIIWDGAGWRRGSKVQEFILEDKNIETFYFPRYSPEENPQEHVWKSGRSNVTHNKFIQNIDAGADEFVTYLKKETFSFSLLGFGCKT